MKDILLTINETRKIQQFLFKRGDYMNNQTMAKCLDFLGYGFLFNVISLDSWYREIYPKQWRGDLSLGANLIILWGDGDLDKGQMWLKEFGILSKCELDNETLNECLKEAKNAI